PWARGARGVPLPRRAREDPAGQLARAVPSPAAARRSAPLRHRCPPAEAQPRDQRFAARRDSRDRPRAQAGAAAALRYREPRARGRPRRPETCARRQRGGRAGGLRLLPPAGVSRMATDFSIVDTRDGIVATWPVMRQLRPHLAVDEYVALVERLQEEHGFRLAQMRVDGDIVAVAGLRFGEWLPRGRYLEIEDFVTSDSCRSQGHG